MDEATAQGVRLWDSLAPAWIKYRDELNRLEMPVTEQMFEAVAAVDGDTILELTAGSGGAGLTFAARRPDVRVLITDFAPGMVTGVEAAIEQQGLKNAEARLVDAQSIGLPEASVDGVFSRHGLMLVPDYRKAFQEIRRVLKPGRRLAYVVWGPLVENPWMMVVGATLIQRGHFTPPPGGGFFPLTTEDENRTVLGEAGFESIDVRAVATPFTYPSFDDYWSLTKEISGPLVEIIAGLPSEEGRAVRDAVEEYTSPFRSGSTGLEFPASRLLVTAS